MIVTEEKKLPLAPDTPLAPQGANNPFTPAAASSSEAPQDGAPPPYEHSESAFTGTISTASSSAAPGSSTVAPGTPVADRDSRLDMLSGDPDDYSTGPSVLPPHHEDPIPPGLPKQNKLRVHKDNHSIKDVFVIDANLPAPPGSPERALDLFSSNGSVYAKVYLIGYDLKRRVELAAKSKNGSVKFLIAECPRTMPISVNCESHNGSVTVLLPPKFTGPLQISHKNGSVTLFPSLKARTRTLDESSTTRRCWVGEWPGETEWDGDECIVGSLNGSVRIGFWEGEPLEKPAGFFKRLFG